MGGKKGGKGIVVEAYLSGVPMYGQGRADMLCGYYCYWMMVVAYGGRKAYQQWCKDTSDDLKNTVERGTRKSVLRGRLNDAGIKVGRWQEAQSWELAWKAVTKKKTPSILWLRESEIQPYGHYVVARGALTCKVNGKNEQQLVINDPLFGERWFSRREFDCSATGRTRNQVLIPTDPMGPSEKISS